MIYKILHSKTFERLKRKVGKRTGIYLKLKRFTASASDQLRTAMILNNLKIDCVIDVGANTGQFAESLIDFGFQGRIISFEPVSSCHQQLLDRSHKYKNWIVADRMAIGDKEGESKINVCDDSVFSSLLRIADSQAKLNPKSRIVKEEVVPVKRLDDIIDQYLDKSSERIVLKIDTQGFERQVIQGAGNLIKRLTGLKIEIPLKPIYDGVDFTFYEIIDFMKTNDFVPYNFNLEGVNLKTGRLNTLDGLFIRR